ncbi:hypothetical protein BH11PLA2_BH11PLA2_53270 [soil metagenome]
MTDDIPFDETTEALDRSLSSLFAEVRPSATLEDRAVRSLRADVRRVRAFSGWQRAVAAGLAACVGLGLLGVAGTAIQNAPYPWEMDKYAMGAAVRGERTTGYGETEAEFGTKTAVTDEPVGLATADLTNPDIGLDSEIKQAVEVERGKANGTLPALQSGKEVRKTVTKSVPAEARQHLNFYGVAATDGTVTLNGGTVDPKNYWYYVPNQAVDTSGALTKAGSGTVTLGGQNNFTGGTTISGGTLGVTDAQVETPKPAQMPASNRPKISPYVNLLQGEKEPTSKAGGTEVAPAAVRKIIIRSGDMDFEVESFDTAVAAVRTLVDNVKEGFVATVNSEKLPNGKVKGSVVVRMPPGNLDAFVLDLRRDLGKAGELKGQRIGSSDITKQYTDLESRLRASKTMEERLLKMIAEGKGEIKQLLDAEKELGVVRTRIEEAEGELRYFGSLVSLSTLTINLAEREIRTAAGLTECERIDAGVEVEDVDAAYRELLKAITAAKGRVSKAELKQQNAGQFSATLHFEVSPDAAGPMRDRLKQLGRLARLKIDQVQTADGGPVPADVKIKRGNTQFTLELYNLTSIAPRETAVLQVATADVPTAYRGLQDVVAKAHGRVLAANLNEQDRQNVIAQLDFEVRRSEEAAVNTALTAAGDVAARTVTRAVETDAVTDSKLLYRVTLFNVAKLKPRETTTLTVEVPDVDAATSTLGAQVLEAKGRQIDSQTSRDRSGQVTAKLVYAVPLAAASGLVEKFKHAGTVRVHDNTRDPAASDGPAATARISLTLTNADPLVAPDNGLGTQIRKGLSFSAEALLKSVSVVIIGLCVVLPFALVAFGGWRLVRRLTRTKAGV